MAYFNFVLTGPLIDAVSETKYDLNGDPHHYDFTVMQIQSILGPAPGIVWPPKLKTVRILYDGLWPVLRIHLGDTVEVEGPTTVIYTNPEQSVPPLSRELRNLTNKMVSQMRWWTKHYGGDKRNVLIRLTDNFAAEKLLFNDWLTKQTKLFQQDAPASLTNLQQSLTQLNHERVSLLERYTQPVGVFVQAGGVRLVKKGPLFPVRPPLIPSTEIKRYGYAELHQQFASYVQEAAELQKYTNFDVHES